MRYSKAQPTDVLYSKSDRLMSFEYDLGDNVRSFTSWQERGGRIYWKNNILSKHQAILECLKLWSEKDIQLYIEETDPFPNEIE